MLTKMLAINENELVHDYFQENHLCLKVLDNDRESLKSSRRFPEIDLHLSDLKVTLNQHLLQLRGRPVITTTELVDVVKAFVEGIIERTSVRGIADRIFRGQVGFDEGVVPRCGWLWGNGGLFNTRTTWAQICSRWVWCTRINGSNFLPVFSRGKGRNVDAGPSRHDSGHLGRFLSNRQSLQWKQFLERRLRREASFSATLTTVILHFKSEAFIFF